jgi:hypothetical protein
MALPASGAIALSDVNTELGLSSTATITMNDTAVRTLFGVASGAIDMNTGHGKSNRVALSYTFASTTTNASLNVTSISGYSAGKSDITITVNSGVYLYSTDVGTPGLTLSGGSSGDTVTLVNNGYIMGKGGHGGDGTYPGGQAGGTALSLGFNTTVNNTNGSAYIGGGGGGGADYQVGGGGGAGGGNGGYTTSDGQGGSIGNAGTDGNAGIFCACGCRWYNGNGGGGGRIFPGVGGSGGARNSTNSGGKGGGAGGGGGGTGNSGTTGTAGGSANNAGVDQGASNTAASGGGGWGARGGKNTAGGGGGAGGKAVALNGNTVTWTSGNTTRVYGAVA